MASSTLTAMMAAPFQLLGAIVGCACAMWVLIVANVYQVTEASIAEAGLAFVSTAKVS